MSTPSVTILKNLVLNWKSNQMEEETIATFYRHWDGYPSCHAIDIANSLVVASRTKPEQHIDFSGASVERNILNNRNWCQHFLKAMCMADADIEFIGESRKKLYSAGRYQPFLRQGRHRRRRVSEQNQHQGLRRR